MSAASDRDERSTDDTGVDPLPPDDDRGSMWLLPALLLGAFLVAIAVNAHAALYKWTDERGRVHYTDQLPAEAMNRERVELNRQGMPVKKAQASRPMVQRLAKTEDEEQRQRQAERERVIAQRRDRALVESYSNEGEIDLAKTRAMATIDGQVQSAEAFIAQMAKRREELEAKKGTYAPRPVPGSIAREIETIDAEIAHQNEFVASKRKEAATVGARYDADKLRFRELRGGAPSGSAITTVDGRIAANQPVPEPAGPPTLRR